MTKIESIESILTNLLESTLRGAIEDSGAVKSVHEPLAEALAKLKAREEQIVMEVIGNTQKITPTKHLHSDSEFYQRHYRPKERNELRTEQHQRYQEIKGRDK